MSVSFEVDFVSLNKPRLCFRHLTFPIGKYVSSSQLVPGDVYELSDPNLNQFPSDSVLLTGDCIVNESMLTGKSTR